MKGTFTLLLSYGKGKLSLDGRSVTGLITLTTAQFLANMAYYDTTLGLKG